MIALTEEYVNRLTYIYLQDNIFLEYFLLKVEYLPEGIMNDE